MIPILALVATFAISPNSASSATVVSYSDGIYITEGAFTGPVNGVVPGISMTIRGIDAYNKPIVNIAAPELALNSNSAVTSGQLFKVKTQAELSLATLGGGAKYDFATNTYTAPSYKVTDIKTGKNINANDVGTAIDVLNQGVVYNDFRIRNISDASSRAGAAAASLAALHPFAYDSDNKLDIMAGFGYYRGKSAGALGVSYHYNERILGTLGGAYDGTDMMYNAGLTFRIGPNSGYKKYLCQNTII